MEQILAVSLAEAKRKLGHILDDVYDNGSQYLVVASDQIKGVLMSVSAYNDLQQRMEDLSDTVALLEAKLAKEPLVPYEEFVKELKAEDANVPA